MSQIFEELQLAEQAKSESVDNVVDMVVSVDEFAALEERILRAVQLVKQERQARIAAQDIAAQAEARAAQAESELHEKETSFGALQSEIKTLKSERDHVRERVERLLQQLDALEF